MGGTIMADLDAGVAKKRLNIDWVWVAIVALPCVLWLLVPTDAAGIVGMAVASLASTAPFILFAILLIATLKATGAETVLAQAFKGPVWRMVLMGAVVGGVAPLCSCEVIPFIAALLAAGVPLAGVMAFWLSSPLMDPAMFVITAGALGVPFAVAKTVAAIGIGVLGGAGVALLGRSALFADPLRATPVAKCGCGPALGASGRPVWAFWAEPARRAVFVQTAWENAVFLGKWLAVAYLLEALMKTYVPAETIVGALGGDGAGTIVLAAVLGGPAYLNGYAAVPLLAGLVDQGMGQGAALAFMLAGGVSCVPAAVAVWALVKPRVFVGYLGFALIGSVAAGMVWAALV